MIILVIILAIISRWLNSSDYIAAILYVSDYIMVIPYIGDYIDVILYISDYSLSQNYSSID